MICEGVHQELMWYISIIISPLYIAKMYSFFFFSRPDGWTATTKDGKRSAQFEHTLLVTETGVEILT
jgi:methionyl aminopeptidase